MGVSLNYFLFSPPFSVSAQTTTAQPETTTVSFKDIFARDLLSGLSSEVKKISSKYLYDDHGDALFQQIMKLQEYYPTRCEFEILTMHKQDFLSVFSQGNDSFNLVELGAGDGTKTKILLNHFSKEQANFVYSPVDISGHILQELKEDINKRFPEITVNPLQCDYFDAVSTMGRQQSEARLVVMFMGANIGNFNLEEAQIFLQNLHDSLPSGSLVMIGFDLQKDPHVMLRAYNDREGVTRAFDMNMLLRINKELGGHFDLDLFDHYPTYDPLSGEVRSFLISKKDQNVAIDYLEKNFHFDAWEAIQIEVSRKYTLKEIDGLAKRTGFLPINKFFDCKHYFTNVVWQKK